MLLALVLPGVGSLHRAEPGPGPRLAQPRPAGRLQAGRVHGAGPRAGLLHAGGLVNVLGSGWLEAGGGEGEEGGGLVGEVDHVPVGLAPPTEGQVAGEQGQTC